MADESYRILIREADLVHPTSLVPIVVRPVCLKIPFREKILQFEFLEQRAMPVEYLHNVVTLSPPHIAIDQNDPLAVGRNQYLLGLPIRTNSK